MARPLDTLLFKGFAGLNDSRNPLVLLPTEALDCLNVRYDDGAITKIAGAAVHGNDVTGGVETWGMYDFVIRAGTPRKFIRMLRTAAPNPVVGTSMYYDNAGTWTLIGSGTEYHNSLHTFVSWPLTDLLLVANKSGNVEPKYNGTVLTVWGLAAPAAVPTFDSNIDGALGLTDASNKYYFRITYWNQTTSEESNPTAASAAMDTLAHPQDGIKLDIPADGAFDANAASHVRVYRTTLGGTIYYLDGSVAYTGAATNYDSILSDTALTAAGTLLEYDNDPPVAMKYIVEHQGRVFGAGNITNPQRLYYSKLEEPENWPLLNYLNVYNPHTGGRVDITGLLPYRDQLWIFTRDQVAILRGSTPADFALEWLPHGIGCVSHHTIQAFGNTIAWWSEMGPIVWDGGQFQFLGLQEGHPRLQTLVDSGLAAARLDDMVSAIWKIGGRVQYVVAYTPTGGSAHTRLLVYDKLQDAFSVRGYGVNCTTLAVVEDTNDLDRLFLGTDSLDVLQLEQGNAIDGGAINAYHDTGWWNAGQPSARKKLRGMSFWVKAESAATWSITVSWYFDFSTTAVGSKTIAVPAARGRPIYLPLRGKFQSVRFRFANAGTNQPFSIDAYEVHYRRQSLLREVAA